MLIAKRLALLVSAVFDGNVTEAAGAVEVPVPTLHRILDGSVDTPRLQTLRKFAEGFGVPLAWILGDISTVEAQQFGSGIPEAVWLVLSYHMRRQNRLRERIGLFEVATETGKSLKEGFMDFNFLPFASEMPMIPALDELSTELDAKDSKDMALIRQWAALSTAFLESALTKLRAMERTR